ncbi:MAG: hypothetical protein D6707_10440 [Bacteroidetes bacterium]|nr:MAG: hypothetical protein D6707_10440 [Bacteroidota bacterium]
MLGDFNSNSIWDNRATVGNHSDIVDLFGKKDINSLYHVQERTEQGEEGHPTFFMNRNVNKPYHIDYCFVSNKIINNGFNINIGKAEDWLDISDHVPLVIDLKIKTK